MLAIIVIIVVVIAVVCVFVAVVAGKTLGQMAECNSIVRSFAAVRMYMVGRSIVAVLAFACRHVLVEIVGCMIDIVTCSIRGACNFDSCGLTNCNTSTAILLA